jgi:hypothetical protein
MQKILSTRLIESLKAYCIICFIFHNFLNVKCKKLELKVKIIFAVHVEDKF